jgi:translation initiation factor 2 beta subunit (eIF-2beta)/eIF-5
MYVNTKNVLYFTYIQFSQLPLLLKSKFVKFLKKSLMSSITLNNSVRVSIKDYLESKTVSPKTLWPWVRYVTRVCVRSSDKKNLNPSTGYSVKKVQRV